MTINLRSTNLLVHDAVELECNKEVEWSSSDKFVAHVSADGVVGARHVGTATIFAKSEGESQFCEVNVQGRYNTYVEPVMGLYLTKEKIKSLETRELSIDESDLVYEDANPAVQYVQYVFYNDEFIAALVCIPKEYLSEVKKFLLERYVSDDATNERFYKSYTHPIGFEYYLTVYLDLHGDDIMVVYMNLITSTVSSTEGKL